MTLPLCLMKPETGRGLYVLYQVSILRTHFMAADWPSRLGARRGAMHVIGQGARARPESQDATEGRHSLPAGVAQVLLAVPAPPRNPCLAGEQIIGGEMGL